MGKLSESEIQARLTDAEGWSRHGDMLVRSWRFASARRALAFIQKIADLSETADHYAEVVWNYRDVRVELATHDAGGVTPADFALAEAINALPTDH